MSMSHWVYYIQPSLYLIIKLIGKVMVSIYLHRRGANGVARFDRLGNARAFVEWNE